MRVLFDVTHPALVHLFTPAATVLAEQGHDVTVAAREKDVTTDLLDATGLPYVVASRAGSRPLSRVRELIERTRALRNLSRTVQPDVVVSQVDPAAVHAARDVGASAVVFDDSEHERVAASLTHRFADVVCTPANFDRTVPNQRRYDGFHELAYLHPDQFTPAPGALRDHGVDPDLPYAVVRFVSWSAHHDIGRGGFSLAGKRRLIDRLTNHGSVYITSEEPLPDDLTDHATPVPPELMHDLLAFADCYVGDSQTMATESAVLGTPAVRTNAFVGDGDMSNFQELEREYGLLRSFADESAAVDCAATFLQSPPTEEMERRRQRLLDAKIDVTTFLLDVIEAQVTTTSTGNGTGENVANRDVDNDRNPEVGR